MPDGVDLWWVLRTDGPPAGYGDDVLSMQERARAERFRQPRDREDWVTSRGLLRVVLGRYVARAPRELLFLDGPDGKPGLADGPHFNVSHSAGLAVVAVTNVGEVGVDVERRRDDIDCVGLARAALGADVAELLAAMEPRQRTSEFYRRWVHREAIGKCVGVGLGTVAGDERPWVSDIDVVPGWAAAVAVRLPTGASPPQIVVIDARSG